MKFDGYRIIARLDDGRVRLWSRNRNDWTARFADVARHVAALPARQACLDGEVAVFQPDGTTSFQALQNAMSGQAAAPPVYVVFDLAYLDGLDLTGVPLEERKAALEALLRRAGDPSRGVHYSEHVVGGGPAFFAHACRLGLEGIVSKRRDAPYRGARGPDWVKVKCVKEQEVVIGGYTDPEGSRVGIGALLAGVNDADGRLVYVGKVGTGFTSRTLRELERRLTPLEQGTSPFASPTGRRRGVHWVEPELVAQVAFTEWTADGKMRHPSFRGLREDKPAAQVTRERAAAPQEVQGGPSGTGPGRADRAARHRAGASTRARPGGAAVEVAGVRLTHADRVVYPPQGITKRDLALFYASIADWILPHLRDRPTTLVRCPEGTGGKCFYQRHIGYWAPDTVRRVKIQERHKVGDYLVIDSLPALIGLVQIGILEIHTWNSVVADLERPNRVVLDLDPGPGVEWPRVIDGARLIRARLEARGLVSFVKTTGGKGLHVVVPLDPGSSWDDGAAFARELAEAIAREHPREYVARMAKAERGGKIFIDYLRNQRGATSVAAYSTRARPHAPVSVPLGWDELSADVRSDHYTVATLPRRLRALRGDPWAGYASVRQSLPH
jgi:bifunctional non-homologous end joining protein LigD